MRPMSRRTFINKSSSVTASGMLFHPLNFSTYYPMKKNHFDVIIVGGSYSGLSAAMALGRALKKVLIIDSGKPCNRQTPYSHNFLTQDGVPPHEIAQLGRSQVAQYSTVQFFDGLATEGRKIADGFEITTSNKEQFTAKKLVFATGIKDIMPTIEGFSDCWGISILHCPYCHGYEVRGAKTGILLDGEEAFEFAKFLTNWTEDLTLYTNGKTSLSPEQVQQLKSLHIKLEEKEIQKVEHEKGYISQLHFEDGSTAPLTAMYAHIPFEQHCDIPISLGAELDEQGYLAVDEMQKTSVEGIYACGDNTTRMRTVSNAVYMGAMTGMLLSKEIIMEEV
ncbi:NAD(P)/FAD-dependent oxidoreductase [Flagellimonas algicola]|uniref:NAD(P)/FAD-dependent oxidoreductase n=1 Tax=Flagellimonas algicola TaxID=2583815 RepID=A0ABY2WLH1_9FLAO|nr:NAD(P)/FAD-dependent oxidoreductase [Allomuricauda algicola]TMU55703.1 NAD(P)/FAD-dependent oxidoreductase [Allomuricauda algicola]